MLQYWITYTCTNVCLNITASFPLQAYTQSNLVMTENSHNDLPEVVACLLASLYLMADENEGILTM